MVMEDLLLFTFVTRWPLCDWPCQFGEIEASSVLYFSSFPTVCHLSVVGVAPSQAVHFWALV